MRRIAVFCGSSAGARPIYLDVAKKLAELIARRGIGLVYGGARVGVMGAIADAAIAAGGEVIGVMPESLVAKEIAHTGLRDLRVVATMHERKTMMAELSDGFIALPGGYGTLEEFFEVVTWTQLGLHSKPCGILNIGGYFDGLLAVLDRAVEEGFLAPIHRTIVLSDESAESLLHNLLNCRVPKADKWVSQGHLYS
jgi:uncharacterized protein (TIGR00730 family)